MYTMLVLTLVYTFQFKGSVDFWSNMLGMNKQGWATLDLRSHFTDWQRARLEVKRTDNVNIETPVFCYIFIYSVTQTSLYTIDTFLLHFQRSVEYE